MYEYVGNIHMHSQYSDGEYPIKEIAKLAHKAGLDFIVITDHETLQGLEKGEEGYHHGVLTLIGEEVNDTCNHYLALNIQKVIPNNIENPQTIIDEVNKQGGFGIIAHPVEKGSPLYQNGITFNWTDCKVKNFQGIEIWNYLSQWKDGIRGIFSGICLLFFPHKGLTGPYPEVMQWLDELQAKGEPVMVFGGSDAHNVRIGLGPLKLVTIGPYYYSFKCINMHILTENKLIGDLDSDKREVYSALEKGRAWVGYDYFYNSKGFRFSAIINSQSFPMGAKVKLKPGLYLEIAVPRKAKVIIMKDGIKWKELYGDFWQIGVKEKGVYRVEVYHKHRFSYRPWIFSNSIWIV